MNFQWLAGLDLVWVVVLISALYLGLLVWAVSRPKEVVTAGGQIRGRWRDLRYWIVLLIVLQVGLHWVFR
jgi:hypothetical protein